jgi:HD superfamily phosphohydrolase
MRAFKRIRTVMYGDQKLSAAELEVIHTPAMQRLYGLRQLGLTDRIYIDASHSRLHHVVGVLHQVDKLVEAIIGNLARSSKEFDVSTPRGTIQKISAKRLVRRIQIRKPVIRFIGLLHDLTHAPFGHTIEDEIQLVDTKHDDPHRQAEAFFRLLCQLAAWLTLEAFGSEPSRLPDTLRPFLAQGATAPLPPPSTVGTAIRDLIAGLSETRAELCLKLTPKYIAEMFAHLGYAMHALLHLEVLHAREIREDDLPEAAEYQFQQVVRIGLEGTSYASLLERFRFEPHLDAYMLDIVGNTVCADLLDYAGRDSHYAGLRLSYDPDRIAENFTLIFKEVPCQERKNTNERGNFNGTNGKHSTHPRSPFEGWCLRTAISLVSHKYRTDVAGELMNLLNVRFYLYERVIFHSTKCAAGSMLGTALQLLGWREPDSGGRPPTLPKHLEFVGDDVFLHDVGAAVDLVIDSLSKLNKGDRVNEKLLESIRGADRAHNGLVPLLLQLRLGKTSQEGLVELNAARLLLQRLMSRRYFRPVFRLLPNASSGELQLNADELAKIFSDPTKRYKTERAIEQKLALPGGTITIHCPRRNTAEKIANVLLAKPDTNESFTLSNIGELDAKTFGEHQEAVRAVEKMYASMWRLTVYAAPEHMERWEEISKSAGQAIFETCDREHGGRYADQPLSWPNDTNLVRELSERAARGDGVLGREGELALLGDDLARAVSELRDSGRLGAIPNELYDPEGGLTPDGRKQVEDALLAALSGIAGTVDRRPADGAVLLRADRIFSIIRTYVKPNGKETELFMETYPKRLGDLPPEDFELIRANFEVGIEQSRQLDKKTKHNRRPAKFRWTLKLLDKLIDQRALLDPVQPIR